MVVDPLNAASPLSTPLRTFRTGAIVSLMRPFVILSSLILVGCTNVQNTFIVEDERQAVADATLVLCGSELPLKRSGRRLWISHAITCEGSGRIRLRYASGDRHDCIVGYVTPPAVQSFTYQATEKGCV
jgi:hypothetical protein